MRNKRSNKGRIKRLIPMIGFLGLLVAGGIFLNSSGLASADVSDPFYRAKLEVEVLDSTAYANNSDCASVILSAYNDGGYLRQKPLDVSVASHISIDGTTTDTGDGKQNWCVRSGKFGRTTITVRLKDHPSVKKSFSLNFIRVPVSLSGNPLAGSKMSIEVENPYNTSPVTEFPNNTDCIVFSVNVDKKDGTPVVGETILIQKPRDTTVSLINNTNTLVGSNITAGEVALLTDNPSFCLKSSKAMRNAKITIKLAKMTSVNRSFNFTFAFPASNMIRNTTDRNEFTYNHSIKFDADIPAWLSNNIIKAQIVYMYKRHVYSGFRWKDENRTAISPMSCNDEGHCTGEINWDHTRGGTGDKSIVKGRYTYRLEFIDSAGHAFNSKNVSGTLR